MASNNKSPDKGKHFKDKEINVSENFLSLVSSYVKDEKVQADVIEAYEEKRPKGYGEVFNGLFRFSRGTLYAWHALSFILASSLVFSMVWQFVLRRSYAEMAVLFDNVMADAGTILNPVVLLAVSITIAILLLAEYGQNVTLNSLFNIYFQWGKKIIPGLALLAFCFSAFSIISSGYGSKEVVEVKRYDPTLLAGINIEIDDAIRSRKALKTSDIDLIKGKEAELEYLRSKRDKIEAKHESKTGNISMIMFMVAMLIEVLIISNTYSIHNYQYNSAKEVVMVNDLAQGKDRLKMGFHVPGQIVPVPANVQTATVAEKSGRQIGFKQSATAVTAPTQQVTATAPEPVRTGVTAVIRPPAKNPGNFDLTRLKSYERTYKSKLAQATDVSRQSRENRLLFVRYHIANFDRLKGADGKVKMDIADADEFMELQNQYV